MASAGAYIFERSDDGAWAQSVEFAPPADGEIRGAGSAVALGGDAVYLGAPSDAGPGAVLRFPASGGSPTLLPSPILSAIDRFGASLSLTGDLLIVGAPGTRDDRGAVHAFNADFPATGASPVAVLSLADGRGGDFFGSSLSGAGAAVLVGAPGFASGAGAVVLFTPGDDGEWSEAARFSFPGEGPGGFGAAVAFDGRSAWVGATAVDRGTGGAHVLGVTVTETAPGLEGEGAIPAPGFAVESRFGSFVALRDDVAVVAALNADLRLGAAVVYERDGGAWVEGTILRESTRTLDAVTGGEAPCHRRRDRSLRLLAGRPGRLRAAGRAGSGSRAPSSTTSGAGTIR